MVDLEDNVKFPRNLKSLTSIFSRIVAPSLVTMTSPSGLTSILSIPLGPSDVLSKLATVRAAMMLIYHIRQLVCTYFVSFKAFNSLFLLLFPQDDEGPPVFVEC